MGKNTLIISVDGVKVFDKIQYPFSMKILNKVGIEGKLLNIISAMYNPPSPPAKIIFNAEGKKGFLQDQK